MSCNLGADTGTIDSLVLIALITAPQLGVVPTSRPSLFHARPASSVTPPLCCQTCVPPLLSSPLSLPILHHFLSPSHQPWPLLPSTDSFPPLRISHCIIPLGSIHPPHALFSLSPSVFLSPCLDLSLSLSLSLSLPQPLWCGYCRQCWMWTWTPLCCSWRRES